MKRALASLLATAAILLSTATPLMAAPQQSLTINARTYQVGVTSAQRSIPNGTYSGFHVSADFSPWTNPSTTNVIIGMQLSFDGGATFQEICSAGENTPPPWNIPAKYGGGTSSTVALDCFIPNGTTPTNVAGFVNVEGHSVPLGQITVTLE